MKAQALIIGVLVLAVFGLTAWVFYLTRNPWSFLILLFASGHFETTGSDK